MSDVKGRRTYDMSRRRAAAAGRRRRVLDTAADLFLVHGYAVTTVAAVAEGAGVSVETIYKSFGGKTGLVRALIEEALEGMEPEPAEHRSDRAAAAASGDPRAIIAAWTTIGRDVVRRGAPLLIMARAAASADPDLARLLEEVRELTLLRMAHNAEALAPHLRAGVTVEQARDVLVAYLTPELYDTLVNGFGWSLAQWADFQARGIAAQLL
ncbi:TetR/AcrR family transcriptional regulator [Pedococcus sp. 5OH_020]|uniref:TetR/AcrR family transcriptional regulator n=1 Tax=Pedococcus sp. 5OH_020 TaxID=2989814 RepID=UPI0022E9AD23|nr:TetR/AcrR family transcriptional regulator [Pedococcus sp. 5OH_020]